MRRAYWLKLICQSSSLEDGEKSLFITGDNNILFFFIVDHLEERDVERGSARRSSLKGWDSLAIVNQTGIGTVSKATLRKPVTDGVERIWASRAHRYHLELH